MSEEEKKPVVQEVQAPPIDPMPSQPADPMQQILQGMLAMQAQTNQMLEKVSEKLDTLTSQPAKESEWLKSEEDMMKEMNNKKIIQRKMYKVMIIKQILPMAAQDQQLHGDNFANGWVVWWDTNKRFDSEAEAKAFGEEVAPGKYRLMPVTVPVPEWQQYKTRRPNITM